MRQSTIISLLLGLVTIDQVQLVDAHRMHHKVHVNKHHQRHRRPVENALAYYDSPFGLDSAHGYGESKVENNIDVGMDSSDPDDLDAQEHDGDYEPSEKMLAKSKAKYGVSDPVPVQSLAQEGKKKNKKHHKKALAETEETEAIEGASDDAVEAEKARQQALKAQEEAENLRQ